MPKDTKSNIGLIILLIIVVEVVILLFMVGLHNKQMQAIKDLNRETQVMWMIPPNAKCAIKMMYFKDKTGKLVPRVKKVCHWDNGMFAPIKPTKPFIDMEKLNEPK